MTAGAMTTADGKPLKAALARAQRRSRIKTMLLVAPLLAFLLVTFVAPILDMLWRSVDNPEIHTHMSRTVQALEVWNGEGLPPEDAFAAAVADLREGHAERTIGRVATRLNYERSGMRSMIMRSARQASRIEDGPYKAALIDLHAGWGDPETWKLIKRHAAPYTLAYYLAALDLRYAPEGGIEAQPENRRIYVDLLIATLWMSALITLLAAVLGYPVAYLLANLPLRHSNLLMILVLLPFWTSLLVRTTTWIVMLQSQGVVNDTLVWIGVIGDDGRLQMIHNRIGTVVAMTHILLPFMILPLYSVMRTIPPGYMRAARSLGASAFTAFRRVYFPQTVAGLGAGAILVFILSIGYYITPALVGGRSGRFITNFIVYHMQESLNWGLAAAIASILLAAVVLLYLAFNRMIGIDKVKLG